MAETLIPPVPAPTPPGTVAPSAEEKKAIVISLAATDTAPAYPKFQINRAGWVNYGEKNDFPQEVIRYNSRSTVNRSIIESTVTYICGKGVRDTAANVDRYVGVPNIGQSWDDLIEPIAKDYKTFGGFYFQVVVNKGSTTVSLFHQDFSEVRVGKVDDFGNPLTFRISKDWKKTSGKKKPIELEVWPGMKRARKGVAYLYYYWNYEPGLTVYAVPDWYAAIEYVKADGTLGTFYNNSINNGFTPSVVISMPSNPSAEKKAEFQKEMEDAFAGANGASSIVILWGENDTVKPVITPFQATANADVYNNVEGIVFQKIISAHRLASPTLAGVSGSGNLSGNAAEIVDAYILYNYTVVEKMRRRILDTLNIFTKINKTGALEIDELDVIANIRATDAATGDEPTTENPPAKLTKKSKFQRAIDAITAKIKTTWK